MSEFEVLRSIAIGRYIFTGSFLHRLDPRVKLSGAILLMLPLIFRAGPTVALIGLLLVLVLLGLGRIPFRYLVRSLRSMLPLFVIVLVLQLLFYPHRRVIAAGGVPLFQWGWISISMAGTILLLGLFIRMIDLSLLLTLLSSTTNLTDLTHGVEGLLRPLQHLGLPADEFSLVLTIALRFVPLLGHEMERLMKAQASRGANFGTRRGGLVQRVQRTFPLIIPLFIAALRRASELAVAMEARGYAGGKGRTHFVQLHMRWVDWIAMIAVVALAVGLALLNPVPLQMVVIGWFREILK